MLDAEGALDETEMAGLGPASEGAVLAETILTAAVSFLVLKTVVVLPLLRLLLRMGALGPDILTVVVILVVRPAGEGEDADDVVVEPFVPAECACAAPIAAAAATAAAAVLGLGPVQAPPAVSAACAAKWLTCIVE